MTSHVVKRDTYVTTAIHIQTPPKPCRLPLVYLKVLVPSGDQLVGVEAEAQRQRLLHAETGLASQ